MREIIKRIFSINIINFFKKIIPSKKNSFIKKLKFCFIDRIIHIGSSYGGWSFFDDTNLEDKFVISAGLGEDASFDIELINKYNCKVIAVDPTPRAIDHFNQIIKNSGAPKINPYKEGGKQEISSYDLKKINDKNFILISKGLYNQDNVELKFFAPPNKEHVSHSIIDWQNNYEQKSDFIKIKTTTIYNILKKFKIKNIEMIKLDIEGSEVEVLDNMIEDKIFPNQILVEFDELNNINDKAVQRFSNIHEKLLFEDYKLIKTKSKFPDFLYIKNSYLKKYKQII